MANEGMHSNGSTHGPNNQGPVNYELHEELHLASSVILSVGIFLIGLGVVLFAGVASTPVIEVFGIFTFAVGGLMLIDGIRRKVTIKS